jgi:hypothetical protein
MPGTVRSPFAALGRKSKPMSPEPLDYGWFFLTRRMPWDLSRPRFMDYLKESLDDKTDADPSFPAQLRSAA